MSDNEDVVNSVAKLICISKEHGTQIRELTENTIFILNQIAKLQDHMIQLQEKLITIMQAK